MGAGAEAAGLPIGLCLWDVSAPNGAARPRGTSPKALTMSNVAADFAERIRSGPTAYAAWCGMPEPVIGELMVRAGFDCAVLDMQHGAIDLSRAILGIALVAGAGKPAILRIPVGDVATASRALDAGAAGVIAPMINSVDEARTFASFMKFPPMGERSWGPHRALALTGKSSVDYLRTANRETLAIAMIETRAALAALDGILGVPGIDGVFVGPSDLSIALTDGGTVDQMHPDVDAALDHVLARALAHGKFASAFCANGHRAGELAARGYKLLSIGTDGILLGEGSRAALDAAHRTAGTGGVASGSY